jgi:hypothetical protein
MKIAVTVRSSDVGTFKVLLDRVRSKNPEVTILEAPNGLNYPYPFPVVSVNSEAGWDRHFGSEALTILEDFVKSR